MKTIIELTPNYIRSGNKLIVEFAEWEKDTYANGDYYKHPYFPASRFRGLDEMLFHIDWNWQIPVWAEVCEKYEKHTLAYRRMYETNIKNNNPQDAFSVLISIIDDINKYKANGK